jgi:hypothetical protein
MMMQQQQQRARQLLARALSASRPAVPAPASKPLPSVKDLTVQLTMIDYKGDQAKVVGRVGQTLVQACAAYGYAALEDDSSGGGGKVDVVHNERWTEMVFGEGPQSFQSHVVFPREWFGRLPAASPKEREVLARLRQDLTPTSRLATQIVLTKDLDGLVVHVPDSPPLE